jgi:hypothetical protein
VVVLCWLESQFNEGDAMWRVAVLAAALLVLVAGSAGAADWCHREENRYSLALVNKIQFMRVFIGENGPCKVDAARIERSVKYVLATTNIPVLTPVELSQAIKSGSWRGPFPPMMSVSGDLLPAGTGQCLYSWELTLMDGFRVKPLLQSSGQTYVELPDIWKEGVIGITQQNALTERITAGVEDKVKQFVVDRADDITDYNAMRADDKALWFPPPQQQ